MHSPPLPQKDDAICLLSAGKDEEDRPLLKSEEEVIVSNKVVKKERSEHNRLNEVQGLRGVAIIAVLLFHLWPNTFKAGYLGVDIFFVISGYLMCMLLSRKKPLQLSATIDFYFRRLKRIFPTYLFCIWMVLFVALIVLSPTDYTKLLEETRKPLMLIANWPTEKDEDYFNQNQGYYSFFVHLWSLSCELQFYLFVPFITFTLHRCRLSSQIALIFTIAIISIAIQLNSKKDYEHMGLAGRVWQFMFGFLAHYLEETRWTKQKEKHFVTSLLLHFTSYFLPLFLIFSTISPMASDSRLNRFIVTTTSMLIIWRGTENKILGSNVFVYIGDISYSVYLVHWPLFELYKYMNMQLFASFGKGTLFSDGLAFFLIFITLGLVIEMVFFNLGQLLQSWKSLCCVISVLYAMIFLNLILLSLNAINLDVSETTNLMARKEVSSKAIKFMENFDVPEHLPKQESLEWAKNFHGYSIRLGCHSRQIPTSFSKTDMGDLNEKPCVVRRNGTKTMVVFGNSHARASFYGIVNHFKDVIKEATLMFQNGCNFVGANSTDIHVKICKKERRAILPMLRAWKYPIDIIIFVHAYSAKDEPVTGSLKQDRLYQEMVSFFDNLHKIAREVLIIPTVHFDSGFYTYLSVFRRKLTFEEDLQVFRVPIEYATTLHSYTRQRIAGIECDRCLKVDFSNVWCRETEELCETVDQDRRIPFFYDRHHVNTYGSLFVGRYLRNQYDEWLRRN